MPDFRGQFIRIWDHGKGVDSGRAFASYQADDNKSHVHSITDPGHSHTMLGTDTISTYFAGHTIYNYGGSATSTNSALTGITGTNATGGSETRPKNYAVISCIRL